jgi:lysophospholipase L1-like esterase
LHKFKGRLIFVLYPDKHALENPNVWHEQTSNILIYINRNKDRIGYVDLGKDTDWNASLYRDGIHPNVLGNKMIADKISRVLMRN